MDNVTFIDIQQIDGTTKTFAIIDRGNGEFTSMLKETYDAQLNTQQGFTQDLTGGN